MRRVQQPGETTLNAGYLRIVIAALMSAMASAALFAQAKPEYDMGKMQMLFLSDSPEWKASGRGDEICKEHRAYIEGLVINGKLALWGEVTTEGGLREIGVVKTESIEEARAMTQLFPAVKTGMLQADVLSWYAARNLLKPAQVPLTLSNYVFGILGPRLEVDEGADRGDQEDTGRSHGKYQQAGGNRQARIGWAFRRWWRPPRCVHLQDRLTQRGTGVDRHETQP